MPKQNKNRKIYWGVLFFACALFIVPSSAHAGLLGEMTEAILINIAYAISWVAGVIVALLAWVLSAILEMNLRVTESPAVITGYNVTLQLANLGFVFGIIVIAIATILRSQSYGLKQVLWKLLVMAILVNFGLVIAGAVIGFADTVAMTYLRATFSLPGESDASVMTAFATKIAGSMNPQRAFEGDLMSDGDAPGAPGGRCIECLWNWIKDLSGWTRMADGDLAGGLKGVIQAFARIFFSIVYSGIIIIILGTMVSMFVVRYVTLNVLLILLPIAWLCWVFPPIKGNFSKWWQMFIRQSLFAPIAIFFLYLGITMADSAGGVINDSVFNPDENSMFGAANTFFAGLIPIFQGLLSLVVVGAITLGGMMAANSMSVKGGNAAIASSKHFSRAIWGGTGGRAGRVASNRFRTARQKTDEEGKTTNMWQRRGQALAGRLGMGGLSKAALKMGSPQEDGANKKELDAFKVKYNNMEKAGRERASNSNATYANPLNAAALSSVTLEKGEIDGLKNKDRLIKAALRGGLGKEIYGFDPTLAAFKKSDFSSATIGGKEISDEKIATIISGLKEKGVPTNTEEKEALIIATISKIKRTSPNASKRSASLFNAPERKDFKGRDKDFDRAALSHEANMRSLEKQHLRQIANDDSDNAHKKMSGVHEYLSGEFEGMEKDIEAYLKELVDTRGLTREQAEEFMNHAKSQIEYTANNAGWQTISGADKFFKNRDEEEKERRKEEREKRKKEEEKRKAKP